MWQIFDKAPVRNVASSRISTLLFFFKPSRKKQGFYRHLFLNFITALSFLFYKVSKFNFDRIFQLSSQCRECPFLILLTHEGSHREAYRDFQPSLTSSAGGAKGCSEPQVPCTPSLYCPTANSASTQSQQPV